MSAATIEMVSISVPHVDPILCIHCADSKAQCFSSASGWLQEVLRVSSAKRLKGEDITTNSNWHFGAICTRLLALGDPWKGSYFHVLNAPIGSFYEGTMAIGSGYNLEKRQRAARLSLALAVSIKAKVSIPIDASLRALITQAGAAFAQMESIASAGGELAGMRGRKRTQDAMLVRQSPEVCLSSLTKQAGLLLRRAAARGQALRVAEILLEKPVSIALTDKRKRTALHRAVEKPKPDKEVIRLLLLGRADATATDRDGRSPIDIAHGRGFQEEEFGVLCLLSSHVTLNAQQLSTPRLEKAKTQCEARVAVSRSGVLCHHRNCNFQVHTLAAFGGYCCKQCHKQEAYGKDPIHGKLCEQVALLQQSPRALPTPPENPITESKGVASMKAESPELPVNFSSRKALTSLGTAFAMSGESSDHDTIVKTVNTERAGDASGSKADVVDHDTIFETVNTERAGDASGSKTDVVDTIGITLEQQPRDEAERFSRSVRIMKVPVRQINRSHQYISSKFRDGHTFGELVSRLDNGHYDPLKESFLRLDLVEWTGWGYFAITGNRRVHCLHRHQKHVGHDVFIEARVLTLPGAFLSLMNVPAFSKFVRGFTTRDVPRRHIYHHRRLRRRSISAERRTKRQLSSIFSWSISGR